MAGLVRFEVTKRSPILQGKAFGASAHISQTADRRGADTRVCGVEARLDALSHLRHTVEGARRHEHLHDT
jgi:hypothetical protein